MMSVTNIESLGRVKDILKSGLWAMPIQDSPIHDLHLGELAPLPQLPSATHMTKLLASRTGIPV